MKAVSRKGKELQEKDKKIKEVLGGVAVRAVM